MQHHAGGGDERLEFHARAGVQSGVAREISGHGIRRHDEEVLVRSGRKAVDQPRVESALQGRGAIDGQPIKSRAGVGAAHFDVESPVGQLGEVADLNCAG